MKSLLFALIVFASLSSFANESLPSADLKTAMACHQAMKQIDPHHQIYDFNGMSVARSTVDGTKGELRLVLSDGNRLYTLTDVSPSYKDSFRSSFHKFRLIVPSETGQKKTFCVEMTADRTIRDQVTKMAASPPADCSKDREKTAVVATGAAKNQALRDFQFHLGASAHASGEIVRRFGDRPGTSSTYTQEYLDKIKSARIERCKGIPTMSLSLTRLNAFIELQNAVDRSNGKPTPLKSGPGVD